jgi:hypothetical protein
MELDLVSSASVLKHELSCDLILFLVPPGFEYTSSAVVEEELRAMNECNANEVCTIKKNAF